MKEISNYDIEELKIVKEEYTTACEEIINSIGVEDFEFFASRRNGIYMPEERLKFERIMEKLKNDSTEFLMDGNTTFGINNLTCKVKADATVKEVSAASILAKVSRDRYMDEISSKYPNYDFHKHKGYGTKAHVEAIKLYGRSEEHRVSFRLKALGELDAGIQKSLF